MTRLVDARWGTADAPLPNWRDEPTSDDDTDDDEPLAETPSDVVAMLGFDPAKYDAAGDAMVTAPNIGIPLTSKTAKDSLALDRDSIREIDKDGHLHVDFTNISKANVCPYRGSEIPEYEELGLDPDRIYQLYRDPVELQKGAASFDGKPLLIEHMPTTADDHQTVLTIGAVMNPVFETPYLKARLVVWPGDAIQLIQDGSLAQLSCGYRYKAVLEPGVSPEGDRFDGKMTRIVGNHVAIVEVGRAGSDVIVGDESSISWGALEAAILSMRP